MNEDLQVIEDDSLTAPLRRIGDRLRSYVPPDAPHFQFFIVDMPITNAFTIAGGRVYVTRKAIALAKNEDEIAGLLAHEMGHVLTRQTSTEYRQLFRQVLKVDTLGGRDDIEERYNELLDRAATNRKAWETLLKKQEKDQLSADQMSVYLATRAGYSPEKFADYFDRLAQNRGKKGNWFTDVFGGTNPDSRRYREILKNGAADSATCAGKADRMTKDDFAKWKEAVTAYHGFGKKESLPPNTRKEVVEDPLREGIEHLRFSPDGKYLVAQDSSSIYVLSRDPLKTLFRIDAENSYGAQFTPDSKSVVFYTYSNRIEKWDIAEQQQADADEVYTPMPCIESVLSPWGDRLACLHSDKDHLFEFDLDVYNATSGSIDWHRKDIFDVDFVGYFLVLTAMRSSHMIDLIPLAFSPDGTYLVGSDGSTPFAYDFTSKKPLASADLAGIRDYVRKDFIFINQDVIFGSAGQFGEKSSAVQFPSGKMVESDVPVGPFGLYPAAKGPYLILRPVVHAAAGILDMQTKKIFMANKTPAVDIYDGTVVSERINGEIALYSKGSATAVATTQLPLGPLAKFDAVAISPDFAYVAYSGQTRGALWSLQTGKRLDYLRGFRGAYLDGHGKMNAIFPPVDSYNSEGAITKQEARERAKQKWTPDDLKKEGADTALLDVGSNTITPVSKIERRFHTVQIGPYLFLSAFRNADGEIVKERELEVQEMSTGKQLWSRKFYSNNFPLQYYNLAGNSLTYVWPLDSYEGKQLLKSDAALTARVDSIGQKGTVLVEVDDLGTGQKRFVTPINTGDGSIEIRDVNAVGNTLLISDNHGRLLVYDSSGKMRARTFAKQPTIDPEEKILVARVEPGRLALYDLATLRELSVLTFSHPVVYKQFSGDGKKLAVITSDQSIYTIPVDRMISQK
ncbi:MAG: M48 family metalloprotease [Terriglobia bacterium]|nr:M48 family metalloprotease [Terriglobia bacterium]